MYHYYHYVMRNLVNVAICAFWLKFHVIHILLYVTYPMHEQRWIEVQVRIVACNNKQLHACIALSMNNSS